MGQAKYGIGKIKYLQKDSSGDLKECFLLFRILQDSVLNLIKDIKTNHAQKSMYVKFIFRNKLKSLHLCNTQTLMFITRFSSIQAYCPHFTDEESDVNVPSGKRIHRVLRSQLETHSFCLIAAKLCGTDIQEKETQNMNPK